MIYLDNAATTFPKPLAVSEAAREAMEIYGANPGRSGHALAREAGEKVYEARAAVSSLFAASPEEVVFTKNATEALNVAIKGVKARKIIITDLEHNSVRRPVLKLASAGARVFILSTKGADAEIIEKLEELCRGGGHVIATHVSNVTGRRLPIEEMIKAAKKQGAVFTVDASQSAGVFPTLFENADFICAAGHKSLYGPTGTGILIARRGAETLLEGGSGTLSVSPAMPDAPPERFEAGTLNLPGIAGLFAGVSFVKEKGVDNIAEHGRRLVKECSERLSKIKGVKVYSAPFTQNASMVSFAAGETPSEETAARLDEGGFCVRGGLHCSPLAHRTLGTLERGLVRASFGVFNTENEITEFCKCVEECL